MGNSVTTIHWGPEPGQRRRKERKVGRFWPTGALAQGRRRNSPGFGGEIYPQPESTAAGGAHDTAVSMKADLRSNRAHSGELLNSFPPV